MGKEIYFELCIRKHTIAVVMHRKQTTGAAGANWQLRLKLGSICLHHMDTCCEGDKYRLLTEQETD